MKNLWKQFWSKPHPDFIRVRNWAAACTAAGLTLFSTIQALEGYMFDVPAFVNQALGIFTLGCGIIAFIAQASTPPPPDNPL